MKSIELNPEKNDKFGKCCYGQIIKIKKGDLVWTRVGDNEFHLGYADYGGNIWKVMIMPD